MLAHLAGRSPREVVRTPVKVLFLAAAISAVCAVAVLLVPAGLMTSVLHTDWAKVLPLVLILLVYAFLLASGQTAMVAAKATGRAWLGPRVRTVQLACELTLVATFGLWLGIVGVAVGMVTAWLVAAALAWHGLLRNARSDEAAHRAAKAATPLG
jgi:Na+-driven multidrug efflux pump